MEREIESIVLDVRLMDLERGCVCRSRKAKRISEFYN